MGQAGLPPNCCLMGRDSRGRWVVRGPHNLYGGLFVSRAAAQRFALFEYGVKPVLIPDVLELTT